jgi:hypothetical protein
VSGALINGEHTRQCPSGKTVSFAAPRREEEKARAVEIIGRMPMRRLFLQSARAPTATREGACAPQFLRNCCRLSG